MLRATAKGETTGKNGFDFSEIQGQNVRIFGKEAKKLLQALACLFLTCSARGFMVFYTKYATLL